MVAFQSTLALPLVLPLLLLATLRRRWAVYLVLFSVPFFRLVVVTTLSHSFKFPELAMLVLVGHYTIEWVTDGTIRLPTTNATVWFLGFVAAVALSTALIAIVPANVSVFPYAQSSFQPVVYTPVSFTVSNLTQPLLRVFFVVSVLVLSFSLDRELVHRGIRIVVFGALLTGLVGVAYQLSVVFEVASLFAPFRVLGFASFPTSPNTLGPLPRMWSFPSEPGHTADFLLYALGITSVYSLSTQDGGALTRGEAHTASILLLGFVFLSTGTTGYGGLILLFGALVVASLVFVDISPVRLLSVAGGLAIAGGLVLGIVITFRPELGNVLSYQTDKLLFRAGSGSVRLEHMRLSLSILLERPLLGVGTGSHHAPSTLFTLLPEVGAVGMTLLLGAHVAVFRPCFGLGQSMNPARLTAIALLVAGVTLFLTNLVAKSVSSLLFPWYWVSLAFPLAFLGSESTESVTATTARSG